MEHKAIKRSGQHCTARIKARRELKFSRKFRPNICLSNDGTTSSSPCKPGAVAALAEGEGAN